MTERQNIEIDYCPKCRGVGLDRGELDKIVERSVAQQSREEPMPSQPPAQPYGGHGGQGHGGHGKHGYRRKSWLGEIFD
jgi:Zn-finger nucleic acid-binding protein